MDFKVSYLDAGFATSYFDSDTNSSNSNSTGSSGPKLNHRRYKTQLRDFLSSCRTKRKPLANELYADSGGGFTGYPSAATMYSSVAGGTIPGYTTPDSTALYMQQNLTAPAYQSLYPGVDNRYLTAATDYFAAGYRSLSSYYPDYATHAALGNGYLDVTGTSRIHSLAYDGKLADADKLYGTSAAAAAYMSAAGDPRLCSPLRLPHDSKHGKDSKDNLIESGKNVVVKEEGITNHEYILPSHHSLDHSGLTPYSLPGVDGQLVPPPAGSVLYMCPPASVANHHHPPNAESPKLYDPRQVHSPGLRGSSPAGNHSISGEARSPSIPSSTSYCTLSLSELCGVAAISGTDTVSIEAQEVTSYAQNTITRGTSVAHITTRHLC
jgi:hypothetical protein